MLDFRLLKLLATYLEGLVEQLSHRGAYGGGLKLGSFVLSKGKQAGGGATYLEGPVTITIPVTAPKGTPIGNYLVHGTFHGMQPTRMIAANGRGLDGED